jgi:type I restriction enzyme S subunit
LELDTGAPFRGESFSEPGSGRPLIRIRDLKSFEPQIWTMEQREDEHVVHPGDVLVGMDAEFRSVIWCGPPGVLNQRVCRFRPRAGVARVFALLAIREDLEFCERAKSGTTVIHLNKADIERFEVPNLSVREHESLSRETEPMLERFVAASRESRELSRLRDALIPELLSGRLRVTEAEELAEVVP